MESVQDVRKLAPAATGGKRRGSVESRRIARMLSQELSGTRTVFVLLRQLGCVGSISSAFTNYATATFRKQLAASKCTGARYSVSSTNALPNSFFCQALRNSSAAWRYSPRSAAPVVGRARPHLVKLKQKPRKVLRATYRQEQELSRSGA